MTTSHTISLVKPIEREGVIVLTFYCPCCDKWLYIEHIETEIPGEFFGHPKLEREVLQNGKRFDA
jgi:hypothetical protein